MTIHATPMIVERLAAIVGARHVIGPDGDQEPYLVDWRGRYRGTAEAIVKPASTAEVAGVVKLCAELGFAIVPQGGNTGMCGAATPLNGRPNVVLRLDRMNTIRAISRLGDSIAVDAGCILADVQKAAESADRLFPLSLGAEGSCQIGGNLSTNAGGTAVLRYGTARELTLGIEAVLPDGSMLDLMTSLRKDSTGVDLKQLFIGAEGTLGIITGAVLKLFPRPRQRSVALAKAEDIEAVLDLLALARTELGDRLGAFEVMSRGQVEVIAEHVPHVAIPFALDAPWFVLIELVDTLRGIDLSAEMEAMLASAFERGLIGDALVASSEAQAAALWTIRHSVSEGSKRAGYVVSHDSAVPLEHQAEFVRRVEARIAALRPEARIVMHGHLGDGNIHVLAILPGIAADQRETLAPIVSAINRAVDEETAALGGSISAEHGIGIANKERLNHVTAPREMALLRQVKGLLDPRGLMNPGKVLSD
ncbi:FAD-binding oxidoreductase [Bosea psychrotolerans]|uniref:FAD/FMN-containing dehydrogenase n=1 Tax=Bosea psychrotolerans TaxID=1871628 RepID=A0A2S4MLS3_9HYPH|nr:FAD-binding oxidoreductase [Bosea psychrotolerans]POR55595.1 FAD/FMN-containing dehydrogenase [Bosea psychrotolerans]